MRVASANFCSPVRSQLQIADVAAVEGEQWRNAHKIKQSTALFLRRLHFPHYLRSKRNVVETLYSPSRNE